MGVYYVFIGWMYGYYWGWDENFICFDFYFICIVIVIWGCCVYINCENLKYDGYFEVRERGRERLWKIWGILWMVGVIILNFWCGVLCMKFDKFDIKLIL